MRLDKFFSHTATLTRRETAKAAKSGLITVNGSIVTKSDTQIDPEKDIIAYNAKPITYKKHTYIMLNKPAGVVSATNDPTEKTVIDLLPENLQKIGLFPCGRLDKNTLGLIILTNDGIQAHKNLSPKHHAEKEYYFECKNPLQEEEVKTLQTGVTIDKGYQTKPCEINLKTQTAGTITLTEGKYHQIKQMLEAVKNKITHLERITFAGIKLDKELERGQWRELTDEEVAMFVGE